MNSNEKKYHLWIPQEEIEEFEKKPMAITEDRGLDYSEHGDKLSQGLQNVLTAYSHLQSDSLSEEDILVFKLVLPDGEDIYSKREMVEKEGLKINAVKDKTHAIVTANRSMFKRLQDRVGTYKGYGSLKHFQYVEDFEPYTGKEKQATSLKKYLDEEKEAIAVDVQMMFIPNLPVEVQDKAVEKLIIKIKQKEGKLQTEPYKLSDGTAVVRAIIPMGNIESIADDAAIYRIEQTSFFHISPSALNVFGAQMQLDPSIDITALPVVAVLDSGVEVPIDFDALVPVHWEATGCSGVGSSHGTAVAGKVIFSHIGMQLTNAYLIPRAKVIDCKIYGNEAGTITRKRISTSEAPNV